MWIPVRVEAEVERVHVQWCHGVFLEVITVAPTPTHTQVAPAQIILFGSW